MAREKSSAPSRGPGSFFWFFWCPKARIVYDLFHVVARYGRAMQSGIASLEKFARILKGYLRGILYFFLKIRAAFPGNPG